MPKLTTDQIKEIARELKNLADPCEICPRRCQAKRFHGRTGFCGLGNSAVISSTLAHFGEEPPITGKTGSGTIFLTGCNARCIFCQNYQISQEGIGNPISTESLAEIYLKLQRAGCENINWVTPTPHLPFLVEALSIAIPNGFSLPIVYNTNGYDRLEILRLLDGIVDIYLPDMKYGENVWAKEFSSMPNYFEVNVEAVKEMYRQVGILQLDERGVAKKGLLVRHLVLPENTSGSAKIFRTLSAIDPVISVSIMAQYHPCYHAFGHPAIGRRITRQEYMRVIEDFNLYGMTTAYTQDFKNLADKDSFFPDFKQDEMDIFIANKNRRRED